MKCEIIIDPDLEEKVVIYARDHTPLVEQLRKTVEKSDMELVGYTDREIVTLDPAYICCVAVIGGKVYAICEQEQLLVKERLYAVEEKLPGYFVKINQSCIANIHKIRRFDASVSGTLKLCFQNGHTDYVSRRQLKTIKERLGI